MTLPSHDKDYVIVHLADLRPDNGAAFEHALALALAGDVPVISLHASEVYEGAAKHLDPAATLERWGRGDARVRHTAHTHHCCEHPVDTLLDALSKIRPRLLTGCVHQVGALDRLFRGSVGGAVARNSDVPMLFVHPGGPSFVDERGGVRIRSVLIPAGDAATEAAAVAHLVSFADRFAPNDPILVSLLCVGKNAQSTDPPAGLPERFGWRRFHEHGEVDEEIARFIDSHDVDLVLMLTDGHDSVGDAIRGSRTERVLQATRVPLLSWPRRV